MKSRLIISLVLMATGLLLFGCTSEEVQQMNKAEAAGESIDGAFSVQTTLCRKVSRKSGRRIGAGQQFKVTKKSYVRAFVDFENVKTDRPYTVHLAWIRPDGKEMFRKYADVRQQQLQDDQFQTVISWLSAEDMHKVKSDTLVTSEPDFTLETRFNISTRKTREPGLYHFRVYLDRRLLLEEPFTVTGPALVTKAD